MERFEKQIDFLETNRDVDIVGSNIEVFNDSNPNQYRFQTYNSHPLIMKYNSLFSCPFAHPTVVIRVQSLDKIVAYDPSELQMEDYKLWIDLLFHHPSVKFHNIGQVLLKHRKHKTQSLDSLHA